MKRVDKYLIRVLTTSQVFKNLLLGFFLLIAAWSHAQNQRPLVGLVLGGSGANGFANIGVLRVLEEQGIQPDFIVGTGFGALVGGLYSIGYAVDEIEEIVSSQDWNELLVDNINYKELTVEEKAYDGKSILEFSIDKQLQLTLGSGLNSGFKLYKFISRLFLPANDINHFDFLPIPFRCVATDQQAETSVSLAKGSLAEAVYASLVMPTNFDPLYTDSTILAEGPITNPLPASVAKEMGAEKIIGTYIAIQPPSIEDRETMFSILSSSTYSKGRSEAERQKQWVDLLIEPNLDLYNNLDFSAINQIIATGRTATLSVSDQLGSLRESLNNAGPPYAKNFYLESSLVNNRSALETISKSIAEIYLDYFLNKPDSASQRTEGEQLILDSVAISGIKQFTNREVLKILDLPTGKPINITKIWEGIDRLEQIGEFTFIKYDLKPYGNGNILQLECREKPPGKLRVGVFYNSYQQAGINMGFTSRNFILPGSRINLVGSLNNYNRIQFEYLSYMNAIRSISYSLRGHFRQNLVPLIHKDEQSFLLNDLGISFNGNTYLGGHTRIGLGLGWEQLTYHIDEPKPAPSFERIEINNLFLKMEVDINSLDNMVLPRTGLRVSLDYTFRLDQPFTMQRDETTPDRTGSFKPFHQVLLTGQKLLPLGIRQTLDIRGFAGLSAGTSSPFQNHFVVGPSERLIDRSLPSYGLNSYEWAATQAVGGSIAFQHFFRRNLMGSLHINGGYFELPGPASDPNEGINGLNYGLGGSIIYNLNLIGPVRATVSYLKSAEEKLASGWQFFVAYGYRF